MTYADDLDTPTAEDEFDEDEFADQDEDEELDLDDEYDDDDEYDFDDDEDAGEIADDESETAGWDVRPI